MNPFDSLWSRFTSPNCERLIDEMRRDYAQGDPGVITELMRDVEREERLRKELESERA